jgi:hypothetical protein
MTCLCRNDVEEPPELKKEVGNVVQPFQPVVRFVHGVFQRLVMFQQLSQ